MEVGPTTHYVMGGVRVDAESQMSRIPGLFACGECAAGINGANRLGGNSLSDLLVLGKAVRVSSRPSMSIPDKSAPQAHQDQIEDAGAAGHCWLLSTSQGGTEGPFVIQQALQEMLPNLVGIVRREDQMQRAIEELKVLRERAAKAQVTGHRQYNPGWHTALDLHNLLTISEAIARCGAARKESRGGHFRDDYPEKVSRFGKINYVARKGPDGQMQLEEVPIPEMPAELKQIIEGEAK